MGDSSPFCGTRELRNRIRMRLLRGGGEEGVGESWKGTLKKRFSAQNESPIDVAFDLESASSFQNLEREADW